MPFLFLPGEWKCADSLLSSTWFREKDSPDLSEPLRHTAGCTPSVQPTASGSNPVHPSFRASSQRYAENDAATSCSAASTLPAPSTLKVSVTDVLSVVLLHLS